MCKGHADSQCSSHNVRDVVPSILKVNSQWAHVTKTKTPCYFPDPGSAQRPKLLWIGCSDSRISEGDITIVRPGEVFVHRNIANYTDLVHDTNALAVLAYAIGVLGVRNGLSFHCLAIVGHWKCGGVIAAYEASRPYTQHFHFSSATPDPLGLWLAPLVERLRGLWPGVTLEQATKENVQLQVESLLSLKDTILKWTSNQPILVHGLLYDFTTGILKSLSTSEIKP
ncbi:carbonic anhydrase [Pisolithus marmoratus]|nr:carbonic anhydrase [Pisolithus marmoratus]